VAFPEYWLFFLGALFIVVTLFLPTAWSAWCGEAKCLKRKSKRQQLKSGMTTRPAWSARMTPEAWKKAPGGCKPMRCAAPRQTESGGRSRRYGRGAAGEVDVTHGASSTWKTSA
jgi:hypothetical protein